jgi:branched-subunit amino acid transport protein
MSDWVLIVLVAGLTYLSRAAAVALLPPAEGRILEFVDRLPAPLFAGLAMFSLVGDATTVPDYPTMAAVFGALIAAPRRSLGLTLAAGLIAFAIVELII